MKNAEISAEALSGIPHKRYNPLTDEWILVSPHRTIRPWLGQVEHQDADNLPSYDPECYLCPGNKRAGGPINPDYKDVMVFDNDFPALMPFKEPQGKMEQGIYRAIPESGICRVMCFSPRHNLTLAEMDHSSIIKVLETWEQQFRELGEIEEINYVQIFENKGAMMGCSNPHPHCQIWASSSLPEEIRKEQNSQDKFARERDACLLCTCLKEEEVIPGDRTVTETERFKALVPFWAVWPFETIILSKRHVGTISEFSKKDLESLAILLKNLTVKYDNLFNTSFPYSMGIHQAPSDGLPHPEWHFHMHFYPPLLRSATIRKFMVGYELLGTPQRDLTPESAAARLRELPTIHWKGRGKPGKDTRVDHQQGK